MKVWRDVERSVSRVVTLCAHGDWSDHTLLLGGGENTIFHAGSSEGEGLKGGDCVAVGWWGDLLLTGQEEGPCGKLAIEPLMRFGRVREGAIAEKGGFRRTLVFLSVKMKCLVHEGLAPFIPDSASTRVKGLF